MSAAGINIRRLPSSNRTTKLASAAQRPSRWSFRLTRTSKVCQCSHFRISIRRAKLDDREARRIGALQHEAAQLMHKLRRDDASPREYYAEASRVVRLKAALASRNRGIDPNVVNAETAAETFKLDTDSRDRLRRLFEQNDEWQYSGAHNGPGSISPENRRDVLELIENLKA